MNTQVAIAHLAWKELRQLIPLLIMLPIITLLIVAIATSRDLAGGQGQRIVATALAFVLSGMPGLYAAGAGALLVGFEKEQRTLDWLRSLPITSLQIIGVKLAVALAGLLVLWALAIAFGQAVAQSAVPDLYERIPFVGLLNYALYLLPAGFALAWWCRSAAVSLLLIVPVAMLPLLVMQLTILTLEKSGKFLLSQSYYQLLNPLLLFGAVIGLFAAVSLGRRYLAPQSPHRERWLTHWPTWQRYAAGRRRLGYGPVVPPTSALLWQFANQNRAVLCGVSLLLAASILALATGALDPPGLVPGGFLLAFLATSWLGVVVFQGDSAHERIRFLADRGISPATVWWTRQLIPSAILSATIVVAIVAFLSPKFQEISLAQIIPIVMSSAFAVTAVYAVSQWVGQLFDSPILAALGAPVVSVLAFGWGVYAVEMFGTGIILVASLAIIPLILTRLMSRRWMDRRFGASFWGVQAAALSLVVFTPMVPLMVDVFRQPRMPREIALQMEAAARARLPNESPLIELTAGESSTTLDQRLRSIQTQLEESPGPVSASSMQHLVLPLQGTATLLRLSLKQPTESIDADQDPPPDSLGIVVPDPEVTSERYRQALEIVLRVAQRMRQSPRIIEQDAADMVEIWLLQELSHDTVQDTLGESLYRQVVDQLADTAARTEARKQAIAHSWSRFQNERDGGMRTFGGYDFPGHVHGRGYLRDRWLTHHRIGLAVAQLWTFVSGGPQPPDNTTLTLIASQWGNATGRNGSKRSAANPRADDPSTYPYPSNQRFRLSTANQWRAGWERHAADLK